MATATCLDENAALRLLLRPEDTDASADRAHLDACEACRELVAAVAKLVIDDESRGDPLWADPELRRGAQVGAFRIVERVGQGAMGTVYLAEDDRLRRRVALKLLGAELGDRAALRRLRAEARSMARLRHPNVVEVLDVGRCEHGPFVAMQYVDGSDLRAWLAAAPRSTARILEHMRQAGRGLAAAHAAGVVHRDFKPANVLVGRDGRVRVADFGLAVLRRDIERITVTPRGELLDPVDITLSSTRPHAAIAGTPAYMAPEQLGPAPVGPAADQFAFCVTLYEMLAGHRPFPEATLAVRASAIAEGRLERPARPIPRRVWSVLRRGLRADPEQRFADMDALLAALDVSHRRPARWLAGVAVAALAGGLALAHTTSAEDPCRASPDALAWDEAARAGLEAAWRVQGAPSFTTARLVGALDEYSRAWADARHEACRPAEPEPSAIQVGTLACLDGLRTELDAFVAEASIAGGEHAEGFARAAGHLRAVEQCEGATPATPGDPAMEGAVIALRNQYRSAKARGAAADLRRMQPEVRAAIANAERAGNAAVEAELSHMLGVLHSEDGDFVQSGEWFERAYFVAQGAGHEGLAFDAAQARSIVGGTYLHDLAGGWTWARHARAALGVREDVERAVSLLVHEANLHMLASDLDAAAAVLQEAEARLDDGVPEDVALSLYASLGQLRSWQRDLPAARVAYERALERAEEHFGPDHPELVRPLVGLATCEIQQQDYADAEAHFERAIDLAERSGDRLAEAMARGNLGLLHRNLEHPTASLRELLRADALLRQLYPEDHVEIARSAVNVAEAYAAVGRYEEAIATARHGRRLLEAQPVPPGSLLYACDLTEAQAEIMRGATDMVGRFESLATTAPTDNYRVEATIGLVQALVGEARYAEAVRAARGPYADDAPVPAIDMLRFVEGRMFYAEALRRAGDPAEASRQLELALELASRHGSDDPRGVVARIEAAR